jgi:hypothetical protein
VVGVLVAIVLSGCAVSPSVSGPAATAPTPPQATGQGTAVRELARLPVKGRAPKTGYDREMFGQAWSDDVSVQGGHNGCDTRNDVLRRDLRQIGLKSGDSGCAVQSGVLLDPYTGSTIHFRRGQTTSSQVQIDHVVALGNAWETGAQQLPAKRRRDFANDPLNLWAVSGKANQQKGAGDAATWLPSNKSIRCRYVARQVAVKASYGLWVTQAERDAIKQVLNLCPGQPSPTSKEWNTTDPSGR